MQSAEKFRVLLEHWIEHSAAHGAEFEKRPPTRSPPATRTGLSPMYGNHTSSSELCATCHSLKTPFVDGQGNVVSTSSETEFLEQMVFSEWENSRFGSGATKTRCQTCHMQPTDTVTANLRYQSLAYGYVQDLLQYNDEPEVARFGRLYENATRLTETIASATAVVR